MTPLVVAVDQGSSSTKAQAVTADGVVVGRGSVPVGESRPAPGHVEQDPEEIWASVGRAVALAVDGYDGGRVAAVGFTNQRESIVLWERTTGRPLAPMVSWQDQRTVELHRAYEREGVGDLVRRISGLPLDPMFSALKARWLLDLVDPRRVRARRGELCLGTVDSWVLSRLAGDHVVEIGNASRTQLLDLAAGTWSPELLDLFDIPEAVLPRIVASDGPFPAVRGLTVVPAGTPIGAVMGDSHAALFGHGVRGPGVVKATYGTGSSIMALADETGTGAAPDVDVTGALCRTIAWRRRADGSPRVALEGNIRASGATLVWLARLLGSTPGALAGLAAGAPSDGVHLVPAFNGLGAPWWDPGAVGLLSGLTLSTGPAQLARAALESIAFQVADVVRAVEATGAPVDVLLADGGGSADRALMQLQADLLGRPVERSAAQDLSGLGVAQLAGLTAGLWDEATLAARHEQRERVAPTLAEPERRARTDAWLDAVRRARGHGASALTIDIDDHHRSQEDS